MNNRNRFHLLGLVGVVLLASACSKQPTPEPADANEQVSRFGEYSGYSEPRFDEWVNDSLYIEMRDGVKLAVDIARPAVDGVAVDEAFPVVWTHSRYHRGYTGFIRLGIAQERDAAIARGEDPDALGIVQPDEDFVAYRADNDSMLQRLLRHGYVVAAVQVRGGGASFGQYRGLFSPEETRDAYEIIDWLSKQPWSDGNVGMYGLSYLGITQYMAAGTQHPALKAITPAGALMDFYSNWHGGGILQHDISEYWSDVTVRLDYELLPARVAEDVEGVMLEEAVAQHIDNYRTYPSWLQTPYRDSEIPEWSWYKFGPMAVFDEILSNPHVAIYHINGWYDLFKTETLLWYVNFPGPDKLLMGPWSHAGYNEATDTERERIVAIERHRWFDYWLKGIDNGIMDEPRVNYVVNDVPGEAWSWHAADGWPVEGAGETVYYLAEGETGTVESVNDDVLALAPDATGAAQDYKVDVSTTLGTATVWDNGMVDGIDYSGLADNDRKSLTYTTAPLDADLTVLGQPVVTLWASTSGEDADVHVVLSEVEADGDVHYVTNGKVRMSLRQWSDAPYDTIGAPYLRAHQEDEDKLEPGEVVELRIPLMAAGHLFNAGNRLRLSIMGADKDNTYAPINPDATITIHTGVQRPSAVLLPIAE